MTTRISITACPDKNVEVTKVIEDQEHDEVTIIGPGASLELYVWGTQMIIIKEKPIGNEDHST